jgi:3-hydroxyacyl-CoA dehydrogenase
MKLLEIVVPDTVGDDVLATAAAFSKRLGKIAVLAGVCDGFIGNRIMSAYRHEADILLEEGAEPWQVDSAMRDFGFAMGIFEMQDLAGLDIAWAMRKRRLAQRKPDAAYVHIADRLCEAGRFGRKTGAGWYDYEDSGRKPSQVVADVIAQERAAKGITPRALKDSEIIDRIIGRMKAEAEAVLQDGIAQSMEDIDVVMVNGYGFPRWRGGPGKC